MGSRAPASQSTSWTSLRSRQDGGHQLWEQGRERWAAPTSLARARPSRRWSSTCRAAPASLAEESSTRCTAILLAGAMRPRLGKCGIPADERPLHPPGVHAATTTTSACGWVQRSAGWGLKPPPRTLSPKGSTMSPRSQGQGRPDPVRRCAWAPRARDPARAARSNIGCSAPQLKGRLAACASSADL